MKFMFFIFLFSLNSSTSLFGQTHFNTFFLDKTMRIDYYHMGNATSEEARLNSIFSYGIWSGNKVNLIDLFNYGKSFYKIVDKQTGQLIYSKGFDSYFKEYQTTDKAIEGISKSFYESAIIPCPKNTFFFILEKRDSLDKLHEVFRKEINPSKDVRKLTLNDKSVKVFTTLNNGTPETKVDIVFIADGYTENEINKFRLDLQKATTAFFALEPLKSMQNKFNIRGVFKPSLQSGVTEPAAGIIKKTAVNTAFDALGSERYMLTEDIKSLRDIAAYVPYDAIFIMANSNRYGGGGIYNFYCTFTSDNINSSYLMTHEFGHSFFGLADEYYTSSTAYNNPYPQGNEPLEPNITADINKATLKWRNLLTQDIEVPTPWEKETFDAFDIAWQKERKVMNEEITKLKKEKAPAAQIISRKDEYDRKSSSHNKLVQEMLANSKYAGLVGTFEGAGYNSTGLYRPSVNCIMFTQANHFCRVCEAAMVKMINWYTGD